MDNHPQARVAGEAVALLDLVTLPSAPFWARCQTRTVLRAWRLWTETIETAELLVSELVTNAVKFSGTAPEPSGYGGSRSARRITLVLRHQADKLIIEVSDPDPGPPVMADVDGEAEGGRGLMLVHALSKEWNYYLPRTGGKVVYCVLPSMASP
jgi:anti-sigma regulatory factor (Ser/Thr protein kinase)